MSLSPVPRTSAPPIVASSLKAFSRVAGSTGQPACGLAPGLVGAGPVCGTVDASAVGAMAVGAVLAGPPPEQPVRVRAAQARGTRSLFITTGNLRHSIAGG